MALKWLRILAFWEGISYLLILFVGMPLKYFMDIKLVNEIIGYAHGLLFVFYCLFLAIVFFKFRMKFLSGCLAFLAAWIPFGTFIADHKIFKKICN